MKTMHKFLAVVISAALAAGLLAGCGAASDTASGAASSEAVSSVAASSEAASSEAASGQAEDAKVKAEFTVTGADGESQTFTLEVTDGLVEAGLISEEEAAAGFVTTVNGETADWDKDQAWWCLTDATGEMTTVGVADIALHDGDSYAFVYTK
jgi:hypothetical protein